MSILTTSSARAEKWLQDNGYPYNDNAPLDISSSEFDTGGQYAVEIPVINSMDVLTKTFNWLEHYDITCDRFNETKGSFLLCDSEIKEMLALCAEKKTGITFALSPRPEYDINASFYRSEFGLEQCRKVNNNRAIAYAMEEAMRLAEFGCTGIIVYDIGILSILSKMRSSGVLPANMMFKASSHCMATNAYIAKILHENGADSITTPHDVSLIMLSNIRQVCPNLIIDVPIDVYRTKGGYIRFHEIAEIAQVCAPLFLKMGASAQDHPYDTVSDTTIHKRVRRVKSGLEHLIRALPTFKPINRASKYRCVPTLTN